MKWFFVAAVIIAIIAIGAIWWVSMIPRPAACSSPFGCGSEITNFEECIAAGFPAMESYPKQCSDGINTFTEVIEPQLSYEAALAIAKGEISSYQSSTCILEGTVKESYAYNEFTRTWWFEFEPNEPNPLCNPACIVSEDSKTAEINWRCTGVLLE